MNQHKFILLNVKHADGTIHQQHVNIFHIVKIFENDKQEIVVELTNYEELIVNESNINVFLERFV